MRFAVIVLIIGILIAFYFHELFVEIILAAALFAALIIDFVLRRRAERCSQGGDHNDDYTNEGLAILKTCKKCGRRQSVAVP